MNATKAVSYDATDALNSDKATTKAAYELRCSEAILTPRLKTCQDKTPKA